MATNVYRGSDGTISVAVETGPEGDLAAAINDAYGTAPVGRVSGVTVRVTNEVKPFHEIGQRFATELRPGNINVLRTIARAHVNGALLKLMLGPARPRAGRKARSQPLVQSQPAAGKPGAAGQILVRDGDGREARPSGTTPCRRTTSSWRRSASAHSG